MTGVFSVISDEIVRCPLCGGVLVYRNKRLRRRKTLLGEVIRLYLRRFRCETCNKLHTEIPNIIQPYKHYDSETIQTVLDGNADSAGCPADESTIRRWKADFEESEADLSQRLLSVCARITDEILPIKATTAPVTFIRTVYEHWLAVVMELLINNGHRIRTRFAFCPSVPPARVVSGSTIFDKGGRKNDKTIADSG